MIQFTQNNKIAVAAVSIFLVSFASMLIFASGGDSSPDYVQSNILEASIKQKGAESSHVYFSGETKGETKNTESEGSVAEKEDGAAEASYRELTDQVYAPIFVLQPDGKPKFLSKNFSSDYGYKLSEIEGKSFFSYVYPVDLSDFATAFTEVVHSGKATGGVGPYRFKNKNGSLSVHVATFLPVVDEAKKVTEVICSIKDITTTLEDFADSAKNDPEKSL